jgi:putative membrane protein
MPSEEPEAISSPDPGAEDVTRRTWLAAERTWLAWWRTGLAAAAAALAVGRLIPALAHGAQWPFQALGIGYGATAIGVAVVGALRQRRTAAGLRRGSFEELPDRLVMAFTAAVVVLALATIAVIAVEL